MKMSINVRLLVKELLENRNLIVNYNELYDGGFDLSVRINNEILNGVEEEKINSTCPYCGSMRVKSLYGTINCDGSNKRLHYICEDCHKEFDLPN